jgi:hypothetical protein
MGKSKNEYTGNMLPEKPYPRQGGFSFVLLLNACTSNTCPRKIDSAPHKIPFWDSTKRGTNIFNTHLSPEDIRAAKAYGIGFVRLFLDKFPSKRRDFLMGYADHYHSLDPDDLVYLKSILDRFTQANMPVVMAMLGLPGSHWEQLNGNRDDLRIWRDDKFQRQAASFLKDLARELRPYPIVVGYNILNEPHPERLFDTGSCHIDRVNQGEVQELLFNVHDRIIHSIRTVDPDTPIIVDSSGYADPNRFKHLNPHDDSHTIYAFHMYKPYKYTNHDHNKGQYGYPEKIADQY